MRPSSALQSLAAVPLLAGGASLLAGGCSRSHDTGEIGVAAAASLREVMPELVRAYEGAHPGAHVVVTYAASGDLKKQVEAGAPVDAVFFAGPRPLDELAAEGRVDDATRAVVATNELVLVARKGRPPLTFETLASLPKGEVVAVGDPRTVPAGEYAKAYLTSLGEWASLEPRLVYGASVSAVLVYARRGEAAAAVVYKTELHGVGDLDVKDTAHGPSAPHATVVAAALRGARPGAADFVRFVQSPAGAKALSSFGFGPP